MRGHTRLTNKLKEKILEFLYKFKKIFLICININTTGRQGAHHCILSSTPQAASSHQLVIPLVRNDSFAAAGEWWPRHRQTFPALILESNLSVRTRDLIHKISSDKCHEAPPPPPFFRSSGCPAGSAKIREKKRRFFFFHHKLQLT